MERKEPYATQEEYNKHIIRYHDVPSFETFPGIKARIISSEKMTVAFITAEPNIYGPIHHHEQEQIMMATDGACDLIIDGKLYPFEKGDVVIFPSNMKHGAYMSDKGFSGIDVFSPPRQDFMARLEEVKKSQKS